MTISDWLQKINDHRREVAEHLGVELDAEDYRNGERTLLYNNPRPRVDGMADLESSEGGVVVTCTCALYGDDEFSFVEEIFLHPFDSPHGTESMACPRCGTVYTARPIYEIEVFHNEDGYQRYDGSV